eukprot:gene20616-25021_t
MVAGGNGGSGRLVSVELYDVAKEQWEGGTAMTTARSSHGMVFLPDVGAMGAVMVAGGFESTSKKNNVGAIVGGALGGLVFLAVLVFVAYRCGGERGNTAD